MLSFNDFINYVFSFYGNGGLYDQKRTKEQIAFATLRYLDVIDAADDDNHTWGNGDSLDRERVRDIMNIICQEVKLPNVQPKYADILQAVASGDI